MKKKLAIIAALAATLAIIPAEPKPKKKFWRHFVSPKTGLAATFAASYPMAKTVYEAMQQKKNQVAFNQNLMQQMQYFDAQQSLHTRNFERVEQLKNDQLSAPCRKVVLYYEQRFIEAYRIYMAERELLTQAIQSGDAKQAKMFYNTTLIRFALLMSVSSDMDFNFQRALEKSEALLRVLS